MRAMAAALSRGMSHLLLLWGDVGGGGGGTCPWYLQEEGLSHRGKRHPDVSGLTFMSWRVGVRRGAEEGERRHYRQTL